MCAYLHTITTRNAPYEACNYFVPIITWSATHRTSNEPRGSCWFRQELCMNDKIFNSCMISSPNDFFCSAFKVRNCVLERCEVLTQGVLLKITFMSNFDGTPGDTVADFASCGPASSRIVGGASLGYLSNSIARTTMNTNHARTLQRLKTGNNRHERTLYKPICCGLPCHDTLMLPLHNQSCRGSIGVRHVQNK